MQSKLIIYLIVFLGLVGGFLYNSELDPAANVPVVPAGVNSNDLNAFRTLHINYAVIENSAFQELRIFGAFPVPSTAPGKDNPFSR
jgi:hypothetical protein